MVNITWLKGLLAHRTGRLAATAIGVSIGVALIASIGTFLSATTAKMTTQAADRVAVDWQVEAQPGAAATDVLRQTRGFPGVRVALPVQFAPTTGLAASSGGSTQTTGPGRVLGLPAGYADAFPGQIRPLTGNPAGVVVSQQTAANLHAGPGAIVAIGRPGLPPVNVRVDGVVDLPGADSLFQRVGAPAGAQPQAPPDNVILLPADRFQQVEGQLLRTRPELVINQVHASLTRSLPSSPSSAFTQVAGQARNFETQLAGAGLVGDNLGTVLDHARSDALYAQLLFLFLGVPGAILAGLLTWAVAGAGAERRRRDQALLRTRGATTRQLVRIALAETALAGSVGVLGGLGGALALGRWLFGTASFGASAVSATVWALGAAAVGLAIAVAAIVLPAWRDARGLTVTGQRRTIGRVDRPPLWARYWLDVAALAAAGLVYWQASKGGYHLVLAPEGLPQVSVNWYALLAPVLAWIGAGLLAYRLADLLLHRGRRFVGLAVRPVAGRLAPTVAASMGRERRNLARAVALVALTVAFAASTAVFNSTYQQQAEVDARLTNGADVTVTESPATRVGPGEASALAGVPGVQSVEPLQHRFAYVGSDLQDLYGVRPDTIGSAGQLQNAWFEGGSAKDLMTLLASRPDSILVSSETVRDFQLTTGDLLRLRLQDGVTKKLTTVPFHYLGIAKEFPTAPTDSFLVANAAYVAKATGSDAVGTFLLQTDGTSPSAVAARVRDRVGTSATVADIASKRRVIGSSLTAVELAGLTKIELGFAVVLAVAATGLVLGLGFQERRRTFAIASALGARQRQLGGFVWGESGLVTGAGIALGTMISVGLTWILVKVLTGVFDPPPDGLAIPWGYLITVGGFTVAAVTLAGTLVMRSLRRPPISTLRDL